MINIKPITKFTNLGILLLLQLFFIGCKTKSDTPPEPLLNTHGIIPLPKEFNFTREKITLTKDFIFVPNNTYPVVSAYAEELINQTLNEYQVSETATSNQTSFRIISDPSIPTEAYELSITKNEILLKAGSESGAFSALQSLKQYLWNCTSGLKQNAVTLPGITISDAPNYSWRGFHLDVARHFFAKEYILKIIDWLAYYKFNKFHLHLSDDQGWRIESKQFPLLNTIGSWRVFDKYDSICIAKATSNPDLKIDPRFIRVKNGITNYGGYYTQQDIAEIIAYAKDHFIEIIPEIDMPGHLSAAIKAYPQLSCNGSTGWSTEFSYPLCPCNPDATQLAFQIWDEVAAQFPSPYAHIGADEVDKSTWSASALCPDFMKTNSLISNNELQSFFVEKLQTHLETSGKTVIAWDDVTDGNVDPNLKIMYWRDWVPNAPVKAAANGNQIIFTRWDLFYFSSPFSEENLQKLLAFDIKQAYPTEVTNKIIGFQGCVWTEEIPSEAAFEAQVFPRLQALSEVNWSSVKDYNSFTTRMIPHRAFLKANHVNLKH